MADRTRHAVFRVAAFLVILDRQMREHVGPTASKVRLIPRDRHVADRTLVFDVRLDLRMVEYFPANAGLPVRIA